MLAKQQARVVIDSILQAHDRRISLVAKYQDAVATYKTSKDSKAFKSSKKTLDDRYKANSDEVSSLSKEVQGLDPDTNAKVSSSAHTHIHVYSHDVQFAEGSVIQHYVEIGLQMML